MVGRRIVVGSDHAGLALKKELVLALAEWGYEPEDLGCHSAESADYPDFALAVARRVASSTDLGLLVCGTGIGMSITANKVQGVRAALCHDTYSAGAARAHNNANVLCLGGRVIGPELAKAVVRSFLTTPFEGGRHQRRVDKIAKAESGREPL
jgi:ribose 5-phosphate isomerase B